MALNLFDLALQHAGSHRAAATAAQAALLSAKTAGGAAEEALTRALSLSALRGSLASAAWLLPRTAFTQSA